MTKGNRIVEVGLEHLDSVTGGSPVTKCFTGAYQAARQSVPPTALAAAAVGALVGTAVEPGLGTAVGAGAGLALGAAGALFIGAIGGCAFGIDDDGALPPRR